MNKRAKGRPTALIPRKGKSFYIMTELISLNRQHASETGRTESSIIEELLCDFYGYLEKDETML